MTAPDRADRAERAAAEVDIVVVGSVNADLVVEVPRHPAPGETLTGRDVHLLPGGKGANQAVAAARLGGRVAFVGAVGTDEYAGPATAELERAGVDLTHLRRVPGPTGLAVVTVADGGENAIVVVPGANAEVDAASLDDAAGLWAQASVCVLQLEIPHATVARAAALADDRGARVLLNAAPAAELSPDLLALADPLVVNEHEARLLLGHELGSPDRATAGLVDLGARSVVLTLGPAGAVGRDAGGAWSVPAPQVEARDTTGAGDAFVGALALALARGDRMADAARFATSVAAASVQRLGAQTSYPWRHDSLP